jgi:sterol desaturase/sphingolipid hydroxylase (fatty acid hydroxylase superfamily)
MQLSKTSYYADFVVYPALLLPLGAMMVKATRHQELVWAIACCCGTAGFSFAEYLLHRFILHHMPPFRRMHQMHHDSPTAMIGTPTWLSALLIASIVSLPAWWAAGADIASGLTFGLILGYLWYVLVHHAVHRWPSRPGSYLFRAKRRHSQHHHAGQSCNFGVSTALWDHVFSSAWISSRSRSI